MSSKRKRIAVTLSETNYEKLLESSARYGITVNSFMAFILGEWVDKNYTAEKIMTETVEQILSSPDDVLSNPDLLEIVKEILADDKDFKINVAKKIK